MNTYIMTFEDAPQERKDNAEALANQLNGEVYTGGNNLWDNFTEICKLSPEGLLLAEDDIKVSSKFKPTEGNEIIHYSYNIPNGYDALYKVSGNKYVCNQLVYYPSWFTYLIANNYESITSNYNKLYHSNDSDSIIALLLFNLRRDFYATGKTYAQTLDFNSTLGHHILKQSANYIGD